MQFVCKVSGLLAKIPPEILWIQILCVCCAINMESSRQDLSPTFSEMFISCDIYLELDAVITFLITFECAFLTIEYGLMYLFNGLMH